MTTEVRDVYQCQVQQHIKLRGNLLSSTNCQ